MLQPPRTSPTSRTPSPQRTSGILGAGEHASVRQQATAALRLALESLDKLEKTQSPAIPPPGHMRFTVRTDQGVFSAQGSVAELASGRHPLSSLGNAVQRLISAMREVSPNRP